METQAYLHRIGVESAEAPTLEFLGRLQERHLLSVPFENLDVVAERPIVLDEAQLYDKIVRHRRGGFCYELNGLFGWLLRQLGYDVSRVEARVFLPGAPRQPFEHLTLLVRLNGTWLVDVGFGDGPRAPVPLPNGEVNGINGRYRVHTPPDEPDAVDLDRANGDGVWATQFRFTTLPRQLTEYSAMCQVVCTSPQSPFTHGSLCTLATATGRITLAGTELTTTDGDQVTKRTMSEAEARQVLAERFGIVDDELSLAAG